MKRIRVYAFAEEAALTVFRLPKWMRDLAREKARAKNLTFSQLMCRAVRREVTKEPE